MACKIESRKEVSTIVLKFFRGIEEDETITEETDFDDDIGVDAEARRGYYRPLKKRFDKRGCPLKGVGPVDFEKADKVKDVVNFIWKAIQKNKKKKTKTKGK